METEVKERLEALLNAIRQSPEYREFEEARKPVNADPKLRRKVDAFRRKSFLFQNADTQVDVPADRNDLFLERTELRENEEINRYLDAELAMCRMLRSIALNVLNVTDIEIEGLGDIL